MQSTIYGYKESILRLEAHLDNENDSRKRSAAKIIQQYHSPIASSEYPSSALVEGTKNQLEYAKGYAQAMNLAIYLERNGSKIEQSSWEYE